MKTLRTLHKRLMTILVFLFGLTSAIAQKVTIDGLKYFLYPDTHEAVIDNGNTWSEELVIPSEVSYNGQTYIVNGIAWLAFDNCTELTKVTIPKTIKAVIHHVLSENPEIGGAVSSDCMNPFVRCTTLESIEVDEANPIMKSVGGVLFSKDGTELYCYPAGIKSEKYVVPDGVTWIGNDAFGYNEHIVSVELPTTVVKLCSAFSSCKRLEQVNLPKDIAYLEAYLFRDCVNLKSIEIPSGVARLGEQVFSGCSSLKKIVLPEGIGFIGGLAFRDCTSLETVEIPSSLECVSDGMFAGCTNLKEVTIKNGVTRISASAFQDCSSLMVLDLPASITHIDPPAFRGCKFNSLIIRGIFDERYLNKHIFDGMDTSGIIYASASEVEKFQKIYEGVVLPLGKYNPTGTGIQVISFSSDNPSPIYDIQGHRLSNPPQKGIYIHDGKKNLAR